MHNKFDSNYFPRSCVAVRMLLKTQSKRRYPCFATWSPNRYTHVPAHAMPYELCGRSKASDVETSSFVPLAGDLRARRLVHLQSAPAA